MNRFSAEDHAFMARALTLGERGAWTSHPNPRVGCVLVRDGGVVGEGWHERAGGPHAEIVALEDAGGAARGATCYVTLEPCAHHGRTPPCCDALVDAGVARVVAAHEDPFPANRGAGLERLRAAGITVDVGLLEGQAVQLNRGFLSRQRRGRPWLRVKLAASLDGRTALGSGESRWITGEAARADGQRWRARASAILTGIGTVLADDPRLDVRLATKRQPRRYVVDSDARLPAAAAMLGCGGPVTLLTAEDATQRPDLSERGVEIVRLPRGDGGLDLAAAARVLGERGENEIHVEAGARLAGGLLAAGLLDELLVYLAPHLMGPGRGLFDVPPLAAMGQRTRLRLEGVDRIGEDIRILCSPESSRP